MITHNLNIAAKYSDNIILLKNGKIKGYGSPKKLINPKTVKKFFNVEAKIKIIDGKPQIIDHS